jgi:serine/threonine protein kinase
LKVYQKSDMDIILKVTQHASPTWADEVVQKFASEAVTWRQLFHPNVLPFYGIYHLDRKPGVCVACPWMENGSLVQFLVNCASDIDCALLVSKVTSSHYWTDIIYSIVSWCRAGSRVSA